MDLDQNHPGIAWNHWTAQFEGKTNLEAFSKAMLQPAQGIQAAIKQLLLDRWIETANGRQLDGIGEIVGQSRIIPDTVYLLFFGYSQQPSATGYNGARYRREDESPVGGTSILPDEEYRQIIRWKIGVNNGHGTMPEIAQSLALMLNTEYVAVSNAGNANIRVFIPANAQQSVFLSSIKKYIPKAAGVGIQVVLGGTEKPFGYAEQGYFGYGVGSYAGVI